MAGPQDVASLRQAIVNFPREVTLALRAIAWRTSREVRTRAQANLRAKTHGTGRTADSIEVIEEPDKHQFIVHVAGDPARPANLPLWLERGTRYMPARPYMRPAADAVEPGFVSESVKAVEGVATKRLGAE